MMQSGVSIQIICEMGSVGSVAVSLSVEMARRSSVLRSVVIGEYASCCDCSDRFGGCWRGDTVVAFPAKMSCKRAEHHCKN